MYLRSTGRRQLQDVCHQSLISASLIIVFLGLSGNTYNKWNAGLKERITQFSSEHPDATVMQFSSYDLFNRLLDNPAQYGFDESTAHKSEGCIWYDHLHPTSKVHDLFATELSQFLALQSPFVPMNGSDETAGAL